MIALPHGEAFGDKLAAKKDGDQIHTLESSTLLFAPLYFVVYLFGLIETFRLALVNAALPVMVIASEPLAAWHRSKTGKGVRENTVDKTSQRTGKANVEIDLFGGSYWQ
jgi:hypothetical protein